MMYLILVDISFSLNTDDFVLISAKFKFQILLEEISDGTSMVIYHVVTIKISEKKVL